MFFPSPWRIHPKLQPVAENQLCSVPLCPALLWSCWSQKESPFLSGGQFCLHSNHVFSGAKCFFFFFFDKNKTTACDCKRESTKASRMTAVMQMKFQTQRSQIANPEELNTEQWQTQCYFWAVRHGGENHSVFLAPSIAFPAFSLHLIFFISHHFCFLTSCSSYLPFTSNQQFHPVSY